METEVIKVSEGLYADKKIVIKHLIDDILAHFKNPSITIDDIRGNNNCTIAINDGCVIKETWEEDHHGNYYDEKRVVISKKQEDVIRIEAVWHLNSLYRPYSL